MCIQQEDRGKPSRVESVGHSEGGDDDLLEVPIHLFPPSKGILTMP